ncbi:MAG: hypothetical protein JZU65_19475 [Chlorobium sp.]|jgi:hypothetical protein|nr:hypothetical protein [Chlorobium sp.]
MKLLIAIVIFSLLLSFICLGIGAVYAMFCCNDTDDDEQDPIDTTPYDEEIYR